MTTKIKSDIHKIGWYQIIGGIIGILTILYFMIMTQNLSTLIVGVCILSLLLYGYSIFSGTLCIKDKEIALTYSLINQFLQLVSFAFLGFAFSYVAGLYFAIGLDLSKSIEVTFNFGVSKLNLNINNEIDRVDINFNLVAFGFIYWIDRLIRKIKEQKTDLTISSVE